MTVTPSTARPPGRRRRALRGLPALPLPRLVAEEPGALAVRRARRRRAPPRPASARRPRCGRGACVEAAAGRTPSTAYVRFLQVQAARSSAAADVGRVGAGRPSCASAAPGGCRSTRRSPARSRCDVPLDAGRPVGHRRSTCMPGGRGRRGAGDGRPVVGRLVRTRWPLTARVTRDRRPGPDRGCVVRRRCGSTTAPPGRRARAPAGPPATSPRGTPSSAPTCWSRAARHAGSSRCSTRPDVAADAARRVHAAPLLAGDGRRRRRHRRRAGRRRSSCGDHRRSRRRARATCSTPPRSTRSSRCG